MNKWIENKLGDIAILEYGKSLPIRERIEGEFPVYGSGGIVGSHKVSYIKNKGIIVGRKGSIGKVYYSNTPFFPIDTVFYIENLRKHYDLKFYYYFLSNIGLEKLNSDAAVPGLNRNWVHSLKAKFPTYSTQRKIAAILTAYDDLIENNNKRISILENMAEQIYKEWFVRMRFPNYRNTKFVKGIPEGWEVRKLGEIAEFLYGKSLKSDERKGGQFPVYGSSGIVGFHSQYFVEGPGIIVGRKGNVGSVHLTFKNFFPIDTAYYVKSDLSYYYLFYLLQSLNFINNDAAVPGLNRTQAISNKFILPPRKYLNKFDNIASSIFNEIKTLEISNSNLTKTRDLLLPRLLSSKLSVENLDVKFPPSMENDNA